MDLIESPEGDLYLYTGSTSSSFRVYNLKTNSNEEVKIPGQDKDKMGNPVRGIGLEKAFLFCYESEFAFSMAKF